MPAAFDSCVRNGGKIRTTRLGGGKYQRTCLLNGKLYMGYVKKKKSKKTARKGK